MKRNKRQTPITKSQGNLNIQAGKASFRYQHIRSGSSVVKELPPKHENGRHPFDLEERTATFGEAIVRFCIKIPRNPLNDRLIGQLAGAGTSVGANYCEADERVSRKDFRNVIGRCAKEAKETKHFLRMVAVAEPPLAGEARELFREARELHLIFASIYRK